MTAKDVRNWPIYVLYMHGQVVDKRLRSLDEAMATMHACASCHRRSTPLSKYHQQVNDICARARVAQAAWAKTSFVERRRVLDTMQKYIVEHMEDIARVCSRDSGKPSEVFFFLNRLWVGV